MNSEKLYIVIPAYNEEANISQVIMDWYPVIEKHDGGGESRLLIINDGSKDQTYKIMLENATSRVLFQPITKPNGGHGSTVLFGYRRALEEGADYIFQTDSDGQTLPSEFEQFWALRDQYDMVIGRRDKRQDGLSRIFVTKTLKMAIKLSFGVNVTDANTPFRLMKAETLKKYIDLVPYNFNLSNVLISVIYAKKNRNVKFLPITFRPRQGGINSINMRKIARIGKQALKDFREINKAIK